MVHKLIHTPNYLLVVDDSEIKEGNWYYSPRTNSPHFCASKEELNLERSVGVKKILAHLPLEGQNLYGLDLLPPLEQEDDVEEKTDLWVKSIGKMIPDKISAAVGFKNGYNKAKEKYKYTEEDMRKAIITTRQRTEIVGSVDVEAIIQYFSQPKMPVEFKCEMEKQFEYRKMTGDSITGFASLPYPMGEKIKTTTNSQGQIVWVGKYIY